MASRSPWLRILGATTGLLLMAGLGALLGFYFAFVRDLPDLRSLDDYAPPLASHVYDREGREIGEFFVERRRLVPYREVPDHVVRAFVAGEDSTFFEHSGIDFMSILRAAWVNLMAGGEIRQGASTITQQTVKGLLLTPERTYRRKIREMILARQIERRFSKQDILYLYLNQIYFGHGAYGIGEAARTYFGKPVHELSISEGAQLAGLPKAPSRYSPFANPERAEQRRVYVLERMREDGFLDDATWKAALLDTPVFRDSEKNPDFAAAAYLTEDVRRFLFDELGGDRVLTGGLRIETTLDIELQRAAVAAVQRGLRDLTRRQGYRGPLRRVPRDAIEAEIEKLAESNGLVASEGADAEQDPEPTAEPVAAEPVRLAGEGPFEAVITEVDTKAQRARVAFGAGIEGTVTLDDVSWARKPDPSQAPRKVRSIDKVFAVGDVAPFHPVADGDEPSDDPRIAVSLYQEPEVEGALLSIDVHRQEVLALVGGYDFERSQFDRVTQARRQPGSSFKPLIYGAAIQKDHTPASIVFDRPVVYTDERSGFVWRPRNYGRSFYGPITLREALARSVNNATVHLFREVGVDYVIDYARKLGIESPLTRDLSLALGSSGVSLLELTRAYAVYPAGGLRVEPRFIHRVTDRDGNVLLAAATLGNATAEESEPADEAGLADVSAGGEEPAGSLLAEPADPPREQVIPSSEAYLVADLLRAVVVDPNGTGWRLRDLRRPVAGKTGTTNDQADAWFLGFSPEIATGVWVGHDSSRFLGWGETGSRAAAPIWVDFMRAALAERPVVDFPVPDQIVFARIDRRTGLLADASSDETVFQPFQEDSVPTESSGSAATRTEGRRRLLRMDDF